MPFKNEPPLYRIWAHMRQRCLNKKFKQFHDYGGRGITVCERWSSYAAFEEDMGPRPSPLHSLDRIDNDGPYSPENCRWATKVEQQRNQRNTRYVYVEGKRYKAADLADIAGVKAETIVERAERGWPYDKVTSRERFRSTRTPVEAVAARLAKQREATHCKNGHEWTPENTRITPQGWKNCRACHREKMRHRQGYYERLSAS